MPASLAALLLLTAGAPATLAQEPERGRSGPLAWQAPADLADFARPISARSAEELARIEAWLDLPPSPEGSVAWLGSQSELQEALDHKASDWYAAVTIPTQRRILMLADRSKSPAALAETFRHELVHWAMIGLGDAAWQSLPAWFHEGIAETWARTDPLAQFASPLAWRAFRGELTPLSRFAEGFGREPAFAAEGYALGFAFVRRLARVHGDDAIARVLARVREGDSLDRALLAVTGLSLVTHEELLHADLGSWSALLAEIYPQIFLILALAMLIAAPFVWRARRRRRRAYEAKWEREDRAELAQEGGEVDDRWIEPR